MPPGPRPGLGLRRPSIGVLPGGDRPSSPLGKPALPERGVRGGRDLLREGDRGRSRVREGTRSPGKRRLRAGCVPGGIDPLRKGGGPGPLPRPVPRPPSPGLPAPAGARGAGSPRRGAVGGPRSPLVGPGGRCRNPPRGGGLRGHAGQAHDLPSLEGPGEDPGPRGETGLRRHRSPAVRAPLRPPPRRGRAARMLGGPPPRGRCGEGGGGGATEGLHGAGRALCPAGAGERCGLGLRGGPRGRLLPRRGHSPPGPPLRRAPRSNSTNSRDTMLNSATKPTWKRTMARIARLVAPGLPHHITQWGNRRQRTFFSDTDYAMYLGLLGKWCRKKDDIGRSSSPPVFEMGIQV